MVLVLTYTVLPSLIALLVGLLLGRLIWGRAAAEEALESAQLRRVVERLRDVASGLASHVGEHHSRIRQISEELTANPPAREDDIVRSVEGILQASQVMMARLESSEKQLTEQARELRTQQQEARTDALTGLANRRAFDEAVEAALARWNDRKTPATVALMDVDHFKKFNDTHGHAVGDLVLKGVADVLRATTPAPFVAARYGGEEFAVVFPGATVDEVKALAEAARRGISETPFAGPAETPELRVTASCGLAQLRAGESIADWLERADKALYHSKQAGRNCGHLHDGEAFLPLVPPAATPAGEPAREAGAPLRDEATGLTLRAGWSDDLRRHLARLCRSTDHLSAMIVEIDGYRALVEAHGPRVRGLIGRTLAQYLKATCRTSDHHGLFDDSRLVTTFPSARAKQALAVADRFRAAVERCRMPLDGEEIAITVRIVVTPCFHTDTADTVLARLEESVATTQANQVCLHDGTTLRPLKPADRPRSSAHRAVEPRRPATDHPAGTPAQAPSTTA